MAVIKQRSVAQTYFSLEPNPYRPDLLRFQRALRSHHASGIPRPPLSGAGANSECPILSSSWPDRPLPRVRGEELGWKADWRLRMCNAEWLTLTDRRGDPGRDNSRRRFANVRWYRTDAPVTVGLLSGR
jgi:hypothetical protein